MTAKNPHSIKGWLGASAAITGVGATGILDISELSAKTVNVAADTIAINDADDSTTGEEAIADIVTAIAGTGTSSGLKATAGVLAVDIADVTAATEPTTAYKVMLDVGGVNKCVTLANVAKPIGETFAGTNSASALAETDGVGRVSLAGVTPKTAPVGADGLLINDSEASNANKLSTITNLAETLAGTVTDSGIENTTGVLAIVPASLTAATPVGGDSLLFADANATPANAARKVTLTNLMEVVAGTVTSSGIENTTGVLSIVPASLTGKNLPIGADTLIIADSEAASVAKGTTITQLAAKMAGTGLTSTAEVLSASGLGIAHHANDDKHSIFFMQGEIDCGESNPVTVDLGALGSKATLVGGYWYTTEAFANGDATNVITLGSATGGGTPIAGTRTITLANTGDGQSNVIGSMAAIIPVAAGVDMASTAHAWLDIPDDSAGTRSAGKISVFLIFQKSA